ncbi:ATP-binding cassette sub-family C member 4 isoform X2 [Lates calcarifer]|uniref:ATP-binding cassette sub-family C member 4 isoform X2 n=1 Tax=Lates calcarifer TaxID=8187 RepID=A0AAJ7LZH1_LATCA|nr:ATP-binding cassette sub-family C member 4 isoform X2 [Lates calcarifer]
MSSKGSQELLFSRTPVRLDAEHTCGTKSLDAPSLEKVSVTVKSQQLLTVIGPVGAGKSSLLSAILGELPCDTGTMKVKGQLTYASQQPWVFPGTIRSNILFGRELNLQRYERVIRACALKKDLELLPYGDLTLIGDRGATLSGGQKARLNLARAVYQEADIYLLDDPLSAVDAEVGKHLFEQVISWFRVPTVSCAPLVWTWCPC